MTDTVDAAETSIPGADAWQRVGLTRREALRRERHDRLRAETLSPWEARLPGIAVWLVWRAFYKGLQPLWLLASLAAAGWFGVQMLAQTGGLAAHVAPQPGEAERLGALIREAVPAGEDARTLWQGRLEDALRGDERRRADIDRFRSWAALGPMLIGPDRLALEAMTGPAGPWALDARLRAGPAWQRRQQLDTAFAEELARGAVLDLDPPALIFAPEMLARRQSARQFAWAVARTSADGFFQGDYRGQFEMRSVPALVVGNPGDTRLYGGVRHLVIQLCADPATRMAGCDSAIIPPARADRLSLVLAGIESGLIELPGRDHGLRSGAEILTAARQAGRLHPQLEAWLEAELASLVSVEDIGPALARAGVRPDVGFAAPGRMASRIADGIDARTAPSAVAVASTLERIAQVRARTSSFEAIRLMAHVSGPAALEDLQRLAGLSGLSTLAVMELLGDAAFQALAPLPPRPEVEPRVRQGLIAALVSAALVLLLTLIRLATPDRLRRASRTSLTDAWISRLLLGRKL